MTYEVVWSNTALDNAAKYMQDDPSGVTAVFAATDRLATDPSPVTARAIGVHRYRYRVGPYRLVYEVDDGRVLVEVIHLGRSNAR